MFYLIKENLVLYLNVIKSLFVSEPFKSALPYTLLSIKRLKTLRDLVQQINEKNIPGDIVECGVFNGGSSAILAYTARSSGLDRRILLFDSFSGLPQPTSIDGGKAMNFTGLCKGKKEKVYEVMKKLNIPKDDYIINEGYFNQTISCFPFKEVSLLHIDADWYESVKFCLDNLYDKVSKGGYIIIDDYGFWEGCRKAVTDFESEHKLNLTIVKIDSTAIYFQK